jgi:hypothetical protein
MVIDGPGDRELEGGRFPVWALMDSSADLIAALKDLLAERMRADSALAAERPRP